MRYQQTQELLQLLELQLISQNLWASTAPSAAALASTAPFACDTLPFEQWLQFIFIPKMQQLIAIQAPLPSNMAIAPMAQYVWAAQPEREPIVLTLEQLDVLLSR
ncbi:YqcC family protein [Shewanella sp.]|uniref:YqcC family protein n=1 Tax=Shewanella sp. TaxID=50422 RepID=UPI003A980A0E